MPVKSLDAEIQKFLPLLGKEEKASLLSVIKSFLALKKKEPEERRMTLDEYNRELDEADAEFERGEFISHEDMKAEIEKWKHQRIS